MKRFFSGAPDKESIFDDPNRHAPAAKIKLSQESAEVSGYQHYSLRKNRIVAEAGSYDLEEKARMLSTVLNEENLRGKVFLDLGAAGGFFTFHSAIMGAEAIAVDMDKMHLDVVRQAARHLRFDNVRIENANIADWEEQADFVNALAIIHWVYSCTAIMGSMDAMIAFFRKLTRNTLIIEWIDPSDVAIRKFGHLDFNRSASDGSYTRDNFVKSLEKQFSKAISLGESRKDTRELFVAKV